MNSNGIEFSLRLRGGGGRGAGADLHIVDGVNQGVKNRPMISQKWNQEPGMKEEGEEEEAEGGGLKESLEGIQVAPSRHRCHKEEVVDE